MKVSILKKLLCSFLLVHYIPLINAQEFQLSLHNQEYFNSQLDEISLNDDSRFESIEYYDEAFEDETTIQSESKVKDWLAGIGIEVMLRIIALRRILAHYSAKLWERVKWLHTKIVS